MTEEEVRAEVGTKAIKFIDEHEKDCLTGFEMMRDFAYEVTKDLEKENAELKEKIKWYSEQVCNKECAEVWGELTKAKEIIKRYVKIYVNPYPEEEIELRNEAEQFLSEVEK